MICIPQESSAGAVIFRTENGNRVYLLLHYQAGHWEFVKGKIERGEKEKETVIREAKEEAGLSDLKFIDGFRERVEYFYRREGQTIHKEVVFLLAETKTKDVKISFEHIGFEWLPYEKATEKVTFGNAKKILEDAQNFLGASSAGKHVQSHIF